MLREDGLVFAKTRQHRRQRPRPQLLDEGVHVRAGERRHSLAADRRALHDDGTVNLSKGREKKRSAQGARVFVSFK